MTSEQIIDAIKQTHGCSKSHAYLVLDTAQSRMSEEASGLDKDECISVVRTVIAARIAELEKRQREARDAAQAQTSAEDDENPIEYLDIPGGSLPLSDDFMEEEYNELCVLKRSARQ